MKLCGVIQKSFVLCWRTLATPVLLCNALAKRTSFLSKPCDSRTLEDVVERGMSYEMWLPTEAIANLLVKMNKLPSPPALYFEIVKKTQCHGRFG